MQLSLQNFSTLVEGMAAAVQGAAKNLLDLTVGSVLRHPGGERRAGAVDAVAHGTDLGNHTVGNQQRCRLR